MKSCLRNDTLTIHKIKFWERITPYDTYNLQAYCFVKKVKKFIINQDLINFHIVYVNHII